MSELNLEEMNKSLSDQIDSLEKQNEELQDQIKNLLELLAEINTLADNIERLSRL